MQQVIFHLVLLVSLLTPSVEGSPEAALRHRENAFGPKSEALLGGFVQCQRENTQSGCLPGFELEQGILRSWTIGLSGAFSSRGLFPSVSDELPKFILGLSGNYYGKGGFTGLWLQMNLRDKFYGTGGDGYSQTIALSPMLGWRWMAEEHSSNFALSLGFEKNISRLTNWLFLVRAEIGLRFLWSEIFN